MKKRKVKYLLWNIATFALAFGVCATAIEFILRWLVFGDPFSKETLIQSAVSAAGIAAGYVIYNSGKTVIRKIRFRKKG